MLSRNPDGYFLYPTFRAYFQSRISSRFCSKIPSLEFQSGNPDPKLNTNLEFKSRNPEGYILHPTYRAYIQSRISPRLCPKNPNPEFQLAHKGSSKINFDSISPSPLWVHDNHFTYQTSSMQLLSHDHPEVKFFRATTGFRLMKAER